MYKCETDVPCTSLKFVYTNMYHLYITHIPIYSVYSYPYVDANSEDKVLIKL